MAKRTESLKLLKTKARELIKEFKGESYIYGSGCLEQTGELAAPLGKRGLLITGLHLREPENFRKIEKSFKKTGMKIIGHTLSARPNSPREDVLRIEKVIRASAPDIVIVVSGGSGIDAAKAAVVLACLGGHVDDYFGTDKVSEKIKEKRGKLIPLAAVQTASGSAAHLTKYSNITDFQTFQKKLIVDEAIVPSVSLFDYSLTRSMSRAFTCDGAFDGLAHCLEVYYGASADKFEKIEDIALTGIELILASLEKAVTRPDDQNAREALGLATDLGGYAIMVGGTNGAHLTSFSLVDILSHGRACAVLNPYYTVFFASAIHKQLQKIASLFASYGLVTKSAGTFSGKELGMAVAKGLIGLSKKVGYPTTLKEISGMSPSHIDKALCAAKLPELEMKLKNMPVPLTPDLVDNYMRPVLEAAVTGELHRIKTLDR